jgi:hypothetical protein
MREKKKWNVINTRRMIAMEGVSDINAMGTGGGEDTRMG